MYLELNEKHVKDLGKEVSVLLKESLKEKNMEIQDVKILLSVELKDSTKPSKT